MSADTSVDDHVDVEIAECLALGAMRSFFVFAGAGSGKTSSLVKALEHGTSTRGHELSLRGQKIAVITFTNAAADEISSRIELGDLVTVSTIHSFAWKLVGEFQEDLRAWMKAELAASIAELESAKSREGTKKEGERLYRLERDRERLASIDEIRRFIYNPAGENLEREALNHSQVIRATAGLLSTKPRFADVLVARHPILFIDESQDTNRALLEAFMDVASGREGKFVLGLFGDTMQRIYGDGKPDIAASIPSAWATPTKVMNHRSPERIVKLINRIRSDVDGYPQQSRLDRGDGIVRLFIAPTGAGTEEVESSVALHMAEVTGDAAWTVPALDDSRSGRDPAVKRLILEHSMAARRFGFADLFGFLRSLPGENTRVLDGSVPELQVFLQHVAPLVEAHRQSDKFATARVVREGSPLMRQAVLDEVSSEPGGIRRVLAGCQTAVDDLLELWQGDLDPTLGQIAQILADTGLFALPGSITSVLQGGEVAGGNGSSSDSSLAWRGCLEVPFSQVTRYGQYFAGATPFATHQGVKGLEFPRVMAVISDQEAGGFLFSYEKLLGAKDVTSTDIENAVAGKDTTLDRTRRLMYVICSRATEALAVVAYTIRPDAVRDFAIHNDWFLEDEVVLL